MRIYSWVKGYCNTECGSIVLALANGPMDKTKTELSPYRLAMVVHLNMKKSLEALFKIGINQQVFVVR